MDNSSSNGTMEQWFVYVAYSSSLVLVILFPAAILNCFNLVSVLRRSSLLSTVRFVLGALSLAGLLNALGLTLQRLSAIVLASNLLPNLPLDVCRGTLWIILIGAACRLTFLALVAVAVLVIVSTPQYARPVVFVVVFSTAFLIICTICGLVFAPDMADVEYASGVSCGPLSVGLPSIAFAVFYVSIFAIVPLCMVLVIPIIALCNIKKNMIEHDVKLEKTLVRFTLFMLVGNIFNFVGIALPAAIAAQNFAPSIKENSIVVEYVPYGLMCLSLLPSPILMFCFFKAVRDGYKRCFCCCCCCFRQREKVVYKASKSC